MEKIKISNLKMFKIRINKIFVEKYLNFCLKRTIIRISFLLFFLLLTHSFCKDTSFLSSNENKNKITIFTNKDECDIQKKDCSFSLPDGSTFELKISSRPISPNQLMGIQLVGREKSYIPIAIDFEGEKMKMGFNRPALERTSTELYEGKFILPTCTTRTFNWIAVILFRDERENIFGIPIYFEVSK